MSSVPFWKYAILEGSNVHLSFVYWHNINIATLIADYASMYSCPADTGYLRKNEEKFSILFFIIISKVEKNKNV